MITRLILLKFIFLISLFQNISVKADTLGNSVDNFFDYELPIGLISLCNEKSSTGFNWKNNRWDKVNWKLSTYIIKKIEHKKITTKKDDACHLIPKNNKSEYIDYVDDFKIKENVVTKVLHRCYQIKEEGNRMHDLFHPNNMCQEIIDHKTNKLLKITCENFTFNPSGLFINGLVHNDVKTKSKYKDGLKVGHGICTSMM